MINLTTDTKLIRWFIWCCDNLPATGTRDYAEGDQIGVRRKAAYYLEHGTTVCHIFWAILWMPIILACGAGLVLFSFILAHVAAYKDLSDKIGPLAFFAPEAIMLGCAAVAALLILAIIGGSKSGFFKLLWQYLSGLKARVCPLVKFEPHR